MITFDIMKRCLFISIPIGIHLLAASLGMTAMSQTTISPELTAGKAEQIGLADSLAEKGELERLADLLQSDSMDVQFKVLSHLSKTTEPKLSLRLLNFLASNNRVVEGSERATIHSNLKEMTVKAFESNSGVPFAVTNLDNVLQVRQRILELQASLADKTVGDSTAKKQASKNISSVATDEQASLTTKWWLAGGVFTGILGLLVLIAKRRA